MSNIESQTVTDEIENKDVPQRIDLVDIYPPETSMSGKNSFYHFCHNRQQQVSYAVCLHTISAMDRGVMAKDQFTDCQRGYHRGDCYAAKMKAEEEDAGQALYFLPRIVHGVKAVAADSGATSSGKYDMSNPDYARGWAIGGGKGEIRGEQKKPRQKAKPTPPPKPKSNYVEATMADVVNAIASDDKAKAASPQPKPVKTTPALSQAPSVSPTSSATRPLPGESTADFIKRRSQLLKVNK